MTEKRRLDVSIRMSVFFGPGEMPSGATALHPIQLGFTVGDGGPALLAVGGFSDHREADLVFLVDPDGCREVIGDVPPDTGVWYLTTEQRAMARAIVGCDQPEPAGQTLRTIRSVELLWSLTSALRADQLVPADGGCVLGELDSRRIMVARRVIDEGWREKLTLDSIARASGLNRVKLTRGFRAMFDCSVAEAIAERRLGSAREMLLVTDLPVSAVGYRCGYSNNASFARAFSRRFGQAPSQVRAGNRLAA